MTPDAVAENRPDVIWPWRPDQQDGTYCTIMLICGSAHAVAWAIFHALVPQHKPVRIE
jgi:hypothetical protein